MAGHIDSLLGLALASSVLTFLEQLCPRCLDWTPYYTTQNKYCQLCIHL